jgi:hypothetical protein
MKYVLGALLLTLAAAGCGGGSGESKAAYRSDLAKVAKDAEAAHQRVEQGAPAAKTVTQVQALLRRFAADEDTIGDEVSKLKPPKDAAAANAELARGQHDDADEIRAFLPKLAKFTSVQQAFAYLQGIGKTKGGREGDEALTKLKQLGYTSGS